MAVLGLSLRTGIDASDNVSLGNRRIRAPYPDFRDSISDHATHRAHQHPTYDMRVNTSNPLNTGKPALGTSRAPLSVTTSLS